MIRPHLNRFVQSVHAPNPRRTRVAGPPRPARAVIDIATGRSIEAALGRIRWREMLPSGSILVIPDPRRASSVGGRTMDAFLVASDQDVAIGLPRDLDATQRERWSRYAEQRNVRLMELGSAGWDRVRLTIPGTALTHVDVPAELASSSIVALTRPAAGVGSIGIWTRVVHPNSALRASLTRGGCAELSAAIAAQYVLCGRIGDADIGAATTDRIAAELLTSALDAIQRRDHGEEARSPWEQPGIQRLCELELGVTLPSRLVLRATVSDNAGERAMLRLAEILNCRVEPRDGGM
jgi:hypothetical protein